MPRPFKSRDIATDPRARTPHIDRFAEPVQEVILRSYTGSEQERADLAAAPVTEAIPAAPADR